MICRVKAFLPVFRDGLSLDEKGASAVEYALIVALISVVIFSGVKALGLSIREAFEAIVEALAP